jgi:hypothetical protein
MNPHNGQKHGIGRGDSDPTKFVVPSPMQFPALRAVRYWATSGARNQVTSRHAVEIDAYLPEVRPSVR